MKFGMPSNDTLSTPSRVPLHDRPGEPIAGNAAVSCRLNIRRGPSRLKFERWNRIGYQYRILHLVCSLSDSVMKANLKGERNTYDEPSIELCGKTFLPSHCLGAHADGAGPECSNGKERAESRGATGRNQISGRDKAKGSRFAEGAFRRAMEIEVGRGPLVV